MTNRYSKQIETEASQTPAAVPDARQVVQSSPPPIPPRRAKGWQFSDNGLLIQRDLTDDDWRNVLGEIKSLRSAYQLIIGDWMLYGFEHGYETTYESMATLTGLQPQTIEVYTTVCRAVPQLIRINPLKFSHYREISELPEDERPHWIQFAASQSLSVRALRSFVNMAYPPQLPAVSGDFDPLTMELSDGVTIERIDLPALPDDNQEPEAVSLPAPVKDKIHRRLMNEIWKKVEIDATLDDEDRGKIWLMRSWCDALIQDIDRRAKLDKRSRGK